MTLFEMQVQDSFRLGERMTAFVGLIQSEAKFIPACECDIIVDGEVRVSIRIDGEMIPKRKQPVVWRDGAVSLYFE